MPTLVILERDPLLRRSLRLLLEVNDRSAVEVATRDGALRVMRALSEPAVLVLYHRLPDVDAMPTLIALANDSALARTHRVVVIPCFLSPLAKPLPIALGNVDIRIVSLPYDLSALQRAIECAMSWQSALDGSVNVHGAADVGDDTHPESLSG